MPDEVLGMGGEGGCKKTIPPVQAYTKITPKNAFLSIAPRGGGGGILGPPHRIPGTGARNSVPHLNGGTMDSE